MDFEEKLRVHAQLEILMSELNNFAGSGGAVAVLLMSLLAVSSVTCLVKMDSRVGITVLKMTPALAFIAAVAIAFGFSAFKQFELLRAESISFMDEQEQATNAEGSLWGSRCTHLWGRRMIGRNFRRHVLGY